MLTRAIEWTKSSFCEAGICVEVAAVGADIFVRDGKQPDAGSLRFSRQDWHAFLDGICAGEFRFV